MREYVTACAAHDNAARTRRLLDRIVVDRETHARFVNTLARLEYVGVRKILKSRRSEQIAIDGLQHILDEAVHALRLKKAAVALAGGAGVGSVDSVQRSPTTRRWRATRAKATCRRSTGAPRRRCSICRPPRAPRPTTT